VEKPKKCCCFGDWFSPRIKETRDISKLNHERNQ
jgi:hypothetical protein